MSVNSSKRRVPVNYGFNGSSIPIILSVTMGHSLSHGVVSSRGRQVGEMNMKEWGRQRERESKEWNKESKNLGETCWYDPEGDQRCGRSGRSTALVERWGRDGVIQTDCWWWDPSDTDNCSRLLGLCGVCFLLLVSLCCNRSYRKVSAELKHQLKHSFWIQIEVPSRLRKERTSRQQVITDWNTQWHKNT